MPVNNQTGDDLSWNDDDLESNVVNNVPNEFVETQRIISNYITEDELATFFAGDTVQQISLNIMHINSRSLRANFSEIESLVKNATGKLSAIAISETWLNKIDADLYFLDGYKFVSVCRESNKAGGGVGMYIDDALSFKVCDDLSLSLPYIECIFVELCNPHGYKGKIIICCIYRPPGSDISLFNAKILDILHTIDGLRSSLCIFNGDYNLDLTKASSHAPTEEFLTNLNSHSFFPLISKPTRVTLSTATLIDNIFVNNLSLGIKSAILYSDVSDHFPIIAKISLPIKNKKKLGLHINTDFDLCSQNKFLHELSELDWPAVNAQIESLKDPSLAYDLFFDLYSSTYKKCLLPNKKPARRKMPKQEWMTPGLVRCCIVKSKLFKNFKITPCILTEIIYKKYRNKLKSVLKKAEKDFYTNKLQSHSSDLRRYWNVLNKLIKGDQQNDIVLNFNCDGVSVSDPKEIVGRFNDYFSSIGQILASKIPKTTVSYATFLQGSFRDSFSLFPTNAYEVINITKKLKNKASNGLFTLGIKVPGIKVPHESAA